MEKHTNLVIITVLTLLLLHSVSPQDCDPASNCKLPNCRCWDDPTPPGGLAKNETPQIVLLSFGYAINGGNEVLYTGIFDNIVNPNGCPTKGSFFVQLTDTSLDVVKILYDRKFEIGVTTTSGTTPSSRQEWIDGLKNVKVELEVSGIPPASITGARAPSLFVGGDDQFESMEESQLEYDSSCVSQAYTQPGKLLWPYTYDFVDSTPVCSIGNDPVNPHKGKWQFLVADLRYKSHICATPSSCSPYFNTSQQAFDLLFNTFADHYESNRAPFILYVDPLWLTVDYQKEATRQFIEFIRAGFDDTWIITNQQALEWIKDPTPTSKINDFKPWKC